MEIDILKYIGAQIKERNSFFDTYIPNAMVFKDGVIVQESNSPDKVYVGISDTNGTAFYLRMENKTIYEKPAKQFSSLTTGSLAKNKIILVAYTFKEAFELSVKKVEERLVATLENINFSTSGLKSNPHIELISSNSSATENIVTELKKQKFNGEVKKDFMCVSVEFYIKYTVNLVDCDPCEVYKTEIVC